MPLPADTRPNPNRIPDSSNNDNDIATLRSALQFVPRPGQLAAIRVLARREDLILIAPTGWGKSVVFQSIPVLCGGICVMIMPLTLLEEDQVSSFNSTPLGFRITYIIPLGSVSCRD